MLPLSGHCRTRDWNNPIPCHAAHQSDAPVPLVGVRRHLVPSEQLDDPESLESFFDSLIVARGSFGREFDFEPLVDVRVEVENVLDGAHEFGTNAAVVEEISQTVRTANASNGPAMERARVHLDIECMFDGLMQRQKFVYANFEDSFGHGVHLEQKRRTSDSARGMSPCSACGLG